MDEIVYEEYSNGATLMDICEQFDLYPYQVYRILRKMEGEDENEN